MVHNPKLQAPSLAGAEQKHDCSQFPGTPCPRPALQKDCGPAERQILVEVLGKYHSTQ